MNRVVFAGAVVAACAPMDEPVVQVETGLALVERGTALDADHEPDDVPSLATVIEPGDTTEGSLSEHDVDCVTVAVAAGDSLGASVSASGEPCSGDLVLKLHAPDGDHSTTAWPDEAGCTALDPATHDEARFLEPGEHAVCVQGLFGVPVTAYELTVWIDGGWL